MRQPVIVLIGGALVAMACYIAPTTEGAPCKSNAGCHYNLICDETLQEPVCVRAPLTGPSQKGIPGWFLLCRGREPLGEGPFESCKYHKDLLFDDNERIDSHNFRLKPPAEAPRCDTNGTLEILGWSIRGHRGVCISGFTDPRPYPDDHIVSVAWTPAGNDALLGKLHLEKPASKVRLVFKYAGAGLEKLCGDTVADTLMVSATGVEDSHLVYAPASQDGWERSEWEFQPTNEDVEIMFRTISLNNVEVKCGPFIHDVRAYVPST